MRKSLSAACAALMLVACGPGAQDASTKEAPAATAQAPATPSGPPVTIAARGENDRGDDVSVARVESLGDGAAKLFSTVGGDPAINGEYLFLAVQSDDAPMEEAKVFKLGDFNAWALESQSAGQFVIKVSRSWIDANGDVKSADERYIVAIPAWSAAETTMTPAT